MSENLDPAFQASLAAVNEYGMSIIDRLSRMQDRAKNAVAYQVSKGRSAGDREGTVQLGFIPPPLDASEPPFWSIRIDAPLICHGSLSFLMCGSSIEEVLDAAERKIAEFCAPSENEQFVLKAC